MREFKYGDFVTHFKRDFTTSDDPLMYVYQYEGVAFNATTGTKVVMYRALYGEGQCFVRDLYEFHSKVDKHKYPEAKQEYRFEKVEEPLQKQIVDILFSDF